MGIDENSKSIEDFQKKIFIICLKLFLLFVSILKSTCFDKRKLFMFFVNSSVFK